jgi:RimJ/RimL family protein N-acetyltransferase
LALVAFLEFGFSNPLRCIQVPLAPSKKDTQTKKSMTLENEKIRLELTQYEDISRLVQIESDNSEFIGQCNVEGHKAIIQSEDEMHLSIFEKADNSLLGHIILAGLKNKDASIEFRRIVVDKKGKGFGKESISLIKKYCFEDLKAHHIWLDVYEDNNRAIELYKSQGFRVDSIQREFVKRNGDYRSLLIMSIKATDKLYEKGEIHYNGKRFIPVVNSENGEVTSDMVFAYKQDGNIVTSEYSGGNIKKGHLIGVVDKYGTIEMRYQQVNNNGALMTGECISKPELMNNGKIRLYENWKWTSGDQSRGHSILEEE